MVPQSVTRYLQEHHTPFGVRPHPRAVTAPEVAAAVHQPGDRVAKSVIFEADERRWIAVLPSTEILDRDRLAAELHANVVRIIDEPDFARQFPDCEVGAEPPFGGLYGLPVIADAALAQQPHVTFRGGSHQDCIELAWDDFERLEHPLVANIGLRADTGDLRRRMGRS
jgi:Ala-tRNA(Pro) deacylase